MNVFFGKSNFTMTSYLTIISLPKSFRQCFSRLIPGFVAILLLALAGVGQAGVLAWNPDTRTLVFSGPEGTRLISLDVYELQSAWDRPLRSAAHAAPQKTNNTQK